MMGRIHGCCPLNLIYYQAILICCPLIQQSSSRNRKLRDIPSVIGHPGAYRQLSLIEQNACACVCVCHSEGKRCEAKKPRIDIALATSVAQGQIDNSPSSDKRRYRVTYATTTTNYATT